MAALISAAVKQTLERALEYTGALSGDTKWPLCYTNCGCGCSRLQPAAHGGRHQYSLLITQFSPYYAIAEIVKATNNKHGH